MFVLESPKTFIVIIIIIIIIIVFRLKLRS